jgi:hypothetical protein
MRRFGQPGGFAVGSAYVRERADPVADLGMASACLGCPEPRIRADSCNDLVRFPRKMGLFRLKTLYRGP